MTDIWEVMPLQGASNLPASPGFSPYLGLVGLVWSEIVAIETIAGINLL